MQAGCFIPPSNLSSVRHFFSFSNLSAVLSSILRRPTTGRRCPLIFRPSTMRNGIGEAAAVTAVVVAAAAATTRPIMSRDKTAARGARLAFPAQGAGATIVRSMEPKDAFAFISLGDRCTVTPFPPQSSSQFAAGYVPPFSREDQGGQAPRRK